MRIKPLNTIFKTLLIFFFVFGARANGGTHSQSPIDNKVYKAYQLKDQSIDINGLPDESAWNDSGWKSGFVQRSPNDGQNATQNTEFSIVYDKNNIYVAFKLYDKEPEKIDRRISKRDTWGGDAAVIYIDSYYDKQTSFMFGVTAGGVKNDGVTSGNSEHADMSRDPVWDVKTRLTKYGWAAEMRIPLSELRYADKNFLVWGLQAARYIYRSDEYALWQHIPRDEAGWAANFGELHGITDIAPKRQVQITPYVSSQLDIYDADKNNPFSDGKDLGFNAGLNGKIGITNNLILDFAVNPDFGQVEADPSKVNLGAHESYFSEKRPFFTEGKNITDYRLSEHGHFRTRDNLLYSRRIGRSPRFYPELSENEYAQLPDYIKIPFSAKLTGKTDNGWSIGVLNALTARTFAKIDSAGNIKKESVEPLTNYFAARVQKDINKGKTQIGGMITAVNRQIKNPALNALPNSAYTGGIDFTQYFKDFKYYVKGKIIGSTVHGSQDAIEQLQLASTRYFQRPDADYINYNPTENQLTGSAATIAAGKDASSGWRFRINATYRSPGLELNDIGYLRSADAIYQSFWSGYKITDSYLIFRESDFSVNQWSGFDFGGHNTQSGQRAAVNLQFLNKWSFYINHTHEGRERSNTMLRGGPTFIVPSAHSNYLRLRSDPSKMVYVSLAGFRKNGTEDNMAYRSISSNLKIQPGPRLNIDLRGSFSENQNDLQYITSYTETDPLYLFGTIKQKTFSLNLNLTFNLSPDISLYYYGAPFISSALYPDFKEITDADADEYYERFSEYTARQILYSAASNEYTINTKNQNLKFGNPDFNFRQFRSNFVFRWEYRPGSNLYLVWSQDKTGSISDGTASLGESLDDLFKLNARDIFLVKYTYLIGS